MYLPNKSRANVASFFLTALEQIKESLDLGNGCDLLQVAAGLAQAWLTNNLCQPMKDVNFKK